MPEPILPNGKKPKIEFKCKRCKSPKYLDKTGYDRMCRPIACRVCAKCGARYMKIQDQFVPIPEIVFVRMR